MSESRNIVLILGNGFDLDLGLKTSYKDFWKSDFCPKDYPAPLINHLNQRWGEDLDAVKWYDLENELLNYYKSLHDPTIGQDILTEEERAFLEKFTAYGQACGWYNDRLDLVQSLIDKGVLFYNGNIMRHVGEHLKEDALKTPIWRDRKALALIKDGLCKYVKSIDKQVPKNLSVASQILLAMVKCLDAGCKINIFTFNYTRVHIPGLCREEMPIHYMHGSCEEGNIIVGTRDGIHMVPEYDFLQKVMDDSFMPPDIVSSLKKAHEV